MKRELLTYKDPKSPVSEVFRTLRTNIQFMNTNGKLKTLLVTSTFPEEGKSWITANLAVTFAQAGKKVILVDADMRKGRQFNIFEVPPRPGLSNYLSNMDANDMETAEVKAKDYIQNTNIENLHILVAGNVPPNPSELLVSERMNNLLKELKRRYDLIIIDGTPCDLVTDAIILSRTVDSTLVVTAQKETKKDNLVRVVKNIKNVGGNVCGVVVNKIDISSKKYSQSYYYGSASLKQVKKHEAGMIKLKAKVSNFFSKMKTKKMQKENQKMYEKIAAEEEREKLEELKREEAKKQEVLRLEQEKMKEELRIKEEQRQETLRLEEEKKQEELRLEEERKQEQLRIEEKKRQEELRIAEEQRQAELKRIEEKREEERRAAFKKAFSKEKEEEWKAIAKADAEKRKMAEAQAFVEAQNGYAEYNNQMEMRQIEQIEIKNENSIDKNIENVVKNDIDDLDNSNLENQITFEQQEKANRIKKQVEDYVQSEMQKRGSN